MFQNTSAGVETTNEVSAESVWLAADQTVVYINGFLHGFESFVVLPVLVQAEGEVAERLGEFGNVGGWAVISEAPVKADGLPNGGKGLATLADLR